MDEMNELEIAGPIVAACEPVSTEDALTELDRRIRELEAAIGDLRTVKAEGYPGRKTGVTALLMAKGAQVESASVDDALRSLSVEQRIAVKSGLLRAGLL